MKIFARFQSKEEHEKLVNRLLKEFNLRVLLHQMQYFKSQGCNTLEDIEKKILNQGTEEKKALKEKEQQKEKVVLGYIKDQKGAKPDNLELS